MAVNGARILALLALIFNLAQDLILIPDPQVSLYAKYAAIIVTALIAAVTAAIQYGVIPEVAKLKARIARKR
jgi:hypothetical protein